MGSRSISRISTSERGSNVLLYAHILKHGQSWRLGSKFTFGTPARQGTLYGDVGLVGGPHWPNVQLGQLIVIRRTRLARRVDAQGACQRRLPVQGRKGGENREIAVRLFGAFERGCFAAL